MAVRGPDRRDSALAGVGVGVNGQLHALPVRSLGLRFGSLDGGQAEDGAAKVTDGDARFPCGGRVRSGEEVRELRHLGGRVDHRLDEEFVDAGLFQAGDAVEEVVAGADQGQGVHQ